MSKKLLSRDQAARRLGLAPRTIYDRVREGDLPAVRVGRVLRFDPNTLDAWLERMTTSRAPPKSFPPLDIDLHALTSEPLDRRLLGALLTEQRETNRLLARLLSKPTARSAR
jgi:excisionase family DNA binding protein